MIPNDIIILLITGIVTKLVIGDTANPMERNTRTHHVIMNKQVTIPEYILSSF